MKPYDECNDFEKATRDLQGLRSLKWQHEIEIKVLREELEMLRNQQETQFRMQQEIIDQRKIIAQQTNEIGVLQRKHGRHMEDIARANALSDQLSDFRAQRHHDVLCLVLKEVLRGWSLHHNCDPGSAEPGIEDCLHLATLAADLAYPPPKAEGT